MAGASAERSKGEDYALTKGCLGSRLTSRGPPARCVRCASKSDAVSIACFRPAIYWKSTGLSLISMRVIFRKRISILCPSRLPLTH